MPRSMKMTTIDKFRLEGVKKITSPDWSGELYQMSRTAFLRHRSDKLFTRPGIYIIYADHFNKQSFGHHMYVGQGDSVGERLSIHATGKKFWNHVLFFTSEWMNIAYAFNIENEFIESARIAGRYVMDNAISGQPKKLGLSDQETCTSYIIGAKQIADMANIDIFSANIDGIFSLRKHPHDAHLRIVSFDSRSVSIVANSKLMIDDNCKELSSLLASGHVLKESRYVYLFKEDVELQIDMEGILPKLLGVHAKNFKNTCGVDVVETIEAILTQRVQQSRL